MKRQLLYSTALIIALYGQNVLYAQVLIRDVAKTAGKASEGASKASTTAVRSGLEKAAAEARASQQTAAKAAQKAVAEQAAANAALAEAKNKLVADRVAAEAAAQNAAKSGLATDQAVAKKALSDVAASEAKQAAAQRVANDATASRAKAEQALKDASVKVAQAEKVPTVQQAAISQTAANQVKAVENAAQSARLTELQASQAQIKNDLASAQKTINDLKNNKANFTGDLATQAASIEKMSTNYMKQLNEYATARTNFAENLSLRDQFNRLSASTDSAAQEAAKTLLSKYEKRISNDAIKTQQAKLTQLGDQIQRTRGEISVAKVEFIKAQQKALPPPPSQALPDVPRQVSEAQTASSAAQRDTVNTKRYTSDLPNESYFKNLDPTTKSAVIQDMNNLNREAANIQDVAARMNRYSVNLKKLQDELRQIETNAAQKGIKADVTAVKNQISNLENQIHINYKMLTEYQTARTSIITDLKSRGFTYDGSTWYYNPKYQPAPRTTIGVTEPAKPVTTSMTPSPVPQRGTIKQPAAPRTPAPEPAPKLPEPAPKLPEPAPKLPEPAPKLPEPSIPAAGGGTSSSINDINVRIEALSKSEAFVQVPSDVKVSINEQITGINKLSQDISNNTKRLTELEGKMQGLQDQLNVLKQSGGDIRGISQQIADLQAQIKNQTNLLKDLKGQQAMAIDGLNIKIQQTMHVPPSGAAVATGAMPGGAGAAVKPPAAVKLPEPVKPPEAVAPKPERTPATLESGKKPKYEATETTVGKPERKTATLESGEKPKYEATETKPGTKPAETKPGETKPGKAKPGETKPGETTIPAKKGPSTALIAAAIAVPTALFLWSEFSGDKSSSSSSSAAAASGGGTEGGAPAADDTTSIPSLDDVLGGDITIPPFTVPSLDDGTIDTGTIGGGISLPPDFGGISTGIGSGMGSGFGGGADLGGYSPDLGGYSAGGYTPSVDWGGGYSAGDYTPSNVGSAGYTPSYTPSFDGGGVNIPEPSSSGFGGYTSSSDLSSQVPSVAPVISSLPESYRSDLTNYANENPDKFAGAISTPEGILELGSQRAAVHELSGLPAPKDDLYAQLLEKKIESLVPGSGWTSRHLVLGRRKKIQVRCPMTVRPTKEICPIRKR